MTFTVTYRDQMGAKREEAVEAADRGACVAACRAHGISPISIREGKGVKGLNGAGRAGAPRTPSAGRAVSGPPQSIPHSHNSIFSHFHISTILAILAFLGILGAAWWWFGVRGAPAPQPPDVPAKSKAMPKEVTPVRPATSAKPLKKHVGGSFKAQLIPKHTQKVQPPVVESQDVIKLRELKNKFSGVPIFKHDCENQIAGILSAIPGERFADPTVDEFFDDALAKCLNEKIEIYDDDPDDVKEQKKAVSAAKDQLGALLAKGESAASVMTDIVQGLNDIADYRDKLEDNLRLLLSEGDSEQDILDYVEEANKMLKEYNAMELSVTPRGLERFRKRLEARKAQGERQQ